MRKKLLAIVCAVGLAMAFAGCADSTTNSNESNSSPMDSTPVCSHTYDDACDADCNECGEERTPSAHEYTADCDESCNVCGDTRVASSHAFDNACDTDCNVCGATRTPSNHVYDNEYDGKCNECGAERIVPEDPVNGGNWSGEVPLK